MQKVKIINREGRSVNGLRIEISNDFDVNIDVFWKKLQNINSLIEVCKPIIYFKSYSEGLPSKWDVGTDYKFKLFMFGFAPSIKHSIKLVTIDPNMFEVVSQEYNRFIPTWNHIITMERLEEKKTRYIDIIDINARGLTYFIALGAIIFYKHRQRKWKKLHRDMP